MDLTISQLIKIILGVLVFVAVVIGVYLFFNSSVVGLFKTNKTIGGILALLV